MVTDISHGVPVAMDDQTTIERIIMVAPKTDVYRHEAEYRGHGIMCLRSYGPCKDHAKIVNEARRIMRRDYGVTCAVTSGGISDWPRDKHHGNPDYNRRTIETQTIFPLLLSTERTRVAKGPGSADWHLHLVADQGTGYTADGETNIYLTGPDIDRDDWRELADAADGGELLEFKVTPLKQGRYWFLVGTNDGYPIKWTSDGGYR